jgi:hypothetical protein
MIPWLPEGERRAEWKALRRGCQGKPLLLRFKAARIRSPPGSELPLAHLSGPAQFPDDAWADGIIVLHRRLPLFDYLRGETLQFRQYVCTRQGLASL